MPLKPEPKFVPLKPEPKNDTIYYSILWCDNVPQLQKHISAVFAEGWKPKYVSANGRIRVYPPYTPVRTGYKIDYYPEPTDNPTSDFSTTQVSTTPSAPN